jgi:hypothetical protein
MVCGCVVGDDTCVTVVTGRCMEWVYMLCKEGGTREQIKLTSMMARRDGLDGWDRGVVGSVSLLREFLNLAGGGGFVWD